MKQQFSLIVSISVLSFFGAYSSLGYAQSSDVIFKCVDAQGSISYVNVNSAKSTGCAKTDLATIDKLSVVSSERSKRTKSSSETSHLSSTSGMVVKDEDQQIRETKRIVVLKRELADEQEQLNTVNSMLTNVGTKDPAQANQLKEMQATHQKNIESLQKELGMKNQVASITPNPLTVVNTQVNTQLNVKNNITTNSIVDDKSSEQPEIVKHIPKKKKTVITNNTSNLAANNEVKKPIFTESSATSINADNSSNIEKIKSNLTLSKLPIIKKFVPTETTVTKNSPVQVNTNLDPAKFLLSK